MLWVTERLDNTGRRVTGTRVEGGGKRAEYQNRSSSKPDSEKVKEAEEV